MSVFYFFGLGGVFTRLHNAFGFLWGFVFGGVGHDTTPTRPLAEYARREGTVVVHSNPIEEVFSVFKRGMIGVYQHCGEAHLHRYLAEFDFRYNRRAVLKVSDAERAEDLLRNAPRQAPYLSTDW